MKEHIIRAVLYENMSVQWVDGTELKYGVNVHLNVHQKVRQFIEAQLGNFILNEGEEILVAFEKSDDVDYHINPTRMEKQDGEDRVYRLQIPTLVHNTPGIWEVQFFVATDYDRITGQYTESYPFDKVKFSEHSSIIDDGLSVPTADEMSSLYKKTLEDAGKILDSSNIENGTGENSVQQKGTTAGYANQMTVGKNNANKENTLFEVGNGESEEERSNAFEVLRDGRAKVQGEPTEETDVVRLKDLSNYVTLDGNETITGTKTFYDADNVENGAATVVIGVDGITARQYSSMTEIYGGGVITPFLRTEKPVFAGNGIIEYSFARGYTYEGRLYLPPKLGTYTLATTDDIPDASFFVEYNCERGVNVSNVVIGDTVLWDGVIQRDVLTPPDISNRYFLNFPDKSGTLATTDDCKKLYRHNISYTNYDDSISGTFTIYSSTSTPFTYAQIMQLVFDNFTIGDISSAGAAGLVKYAVTFGPDGASLLASGCVYNSAEEKAVYISNNVVLTQNSGVINDNVIEL